MVFSGGIRAGLRGFGSHLRGGGARRPRRPSQRCSSSASGGGVSAKQPMNSWLKAALTSGSMCTAGDLCAQIISRQLAKDTPERQRPFALERTLRMGSWGLCFYGPYQNWWYPLLDRRFGAKTTANFLWKVLLNQVALGPVVGLSVFTWTLATQGKFDEIPGKIQRDLVPTMVNGWKFWVPAACVNFKFVPLQYQVLYMSTCGLLWTGYLSFASNMQQQAPAEPEADKGKKGKGK
eukprot:jgi/Tetstr1/435645/TSEL_024545.t1